MNYAIKYKGNNLAITWAVKCWFLIAKNSLQRQAIYVGV